MLVVVHHGDVERFLQAFFDIEALRCLDVLKVDTSEGRSNALNSLAELLGVFLCYLDIKHVDTTIYLKEQSFSLHNGLTAKCANIAQTQYCCTV